MTSSSHLTRYAELIQSVIPPRYDLTDAIDAAGHARAVYPPLILYSRLIEMEINGVVDERVRLDIHNLDASIWSSLTRRVAGELLHEPKWIAQSHGAFQKLLDHQQPTGEFLPPNSSVNPETRWYDELVTLHALASYAVRVPDTNFAAAVERSAAYHLNETQPDHATAQPWGLLAFIQYAPPLADQVLHALAMQYPQGITGIPLLLLVDVLYGLRRLIAHNGTDR